MLKLLGLAGGSSPAVPATLASTTAVPATAAADASGGGSGSGSAEDAACAAPQSSAATSPTNSHGSSGGEGEGEAAALGGPTGMGAAKGMTLAAAMAEIEARFLLNLPEEELASVERLFFQLEQAHWYYEDFLADAHPDTLPHFGLEGFTAALFTHSDCLRHLQEAHADLLKAFNSYKYAVPVYGCVLLTPRMDKLLLVCNWEGTAWGVPRGKVNEGETPMDCAAREVLEETGYDVAGRLREEDAFTMVQNAKRLKMYIVRDVPEDFPFEPRVRKEVSAVKFWPLDALPQRSYNVVHSVRHVRHWMGRLAKRQGQGQGQGQQRRDPSNGRAGSRGKKQQGQGLQGGGGGGGGSRAQSAPGGGRARSSGRQHPRREDPYDANNAETFGVGGGGGGQGGQGGRAPDGGWAVDAMFKANEALTGRKFTYDGNPHRFGDYDANCNANAAAQVAAAGGSSKPQPRPSPLKQRGGKDSKDRGGKQEHQQQEQRGRDRAATVPAVRSLHEIEASLPAPPVANATANASSSASSSSSSSSSSSNAAAQAQALPPAVASLLSGAAAAAAVPVAPAPAPVVVLSCASLEQQPKQPQQPQPKQHQEQQPLPVAAAAGLGDFTFDTKDILSALQF
jgi:mRNA-decapping enzyme subunit 2